MARRSAVDSTEAVSEPGSPRRWLSVGSSTHPDSVVAGRAATTAALAGTDPQLLVVFCSAMRDPAAVLSGIAQVADGVPLIGCSSEAIVGTDGLTGDGVVVTALGGPGFQVHTAAASAAAGRQREAGAEAAACSTAVRDRPYRVLLLLTDGLTPYQETILAGVYSVVGASLPLVGGSASPAPSLGRTFQLHGQQVLSDSVVGAVIGSDAPIGVGLRHGWRSTGEPLVVTRSVNGTVKTLNDQPAVTTYLNRLRAPARAHTDSAAFHEFARTRPIGVSRRTGVHVRDISSIAYLSEGWLHSSGDIPEGGLIWLLEGDVSSVLEATSQAAADAVSSLGGLAPLGLLSFDCVSRSAILGETGMRDEVSRLMATGVPVAGMYTFGEIARVEGINAYHNLTLAVLAMG
ncbi:MAG TPA: FIST N-terminal domain-containing protein [Micromonosporaceae bacterium]|nr:FIST N-terminal domain-containing protein [Micromonosporaceae bacterium]